MMRNNSNKKSRSETGQHRLFFALDFNDEFKSSLYQQCMMFDINGRRVNKENYHLTLQFLGSVNNHQVYDIIERVSIPGIKPFHLSLDKTGYFVKNEIMFIEVGQGRDSIKRLSTHIRQQLRDIEFIKRDKQKFHPHLTIARDTKPPVDFELMQPLDYRVKTFCLMESVEIKSGVYYQTIESWPLFKPSDKQVLLGDI
ncbi:MAG: RNA 2',3'-cyclic phosphodiesterase [Kangiellaceae bacterium]|jgi:2'-5' RNA ligase|nr:RNA 2',3'-cyclic phosphodiesterase [Kangiellaceae bacterium]